jgi:hypothetical protein
MAHGAKPMIHRPWAVMGLGSVVSRNRSAPDRSDMHQVGTPLVTPHDHALPLHPESEALHDAAVLALCERWVPVAVEWPDGF